MQEQIRQLCALFDYPKEATETLSEAAEKITRSSLANRLFNELVSLYESDSLSDFEGIWEPLDRVAKEAGVHIYTVHLLFFLRCAEHLKTLYKEEGLDEEIWKNSVADLKYKLIECHKMYGIWGIFVAFWYPAFFKKELFALGRLEFERIAMPEEYKTERFFLPKDTPVINIHIPSCGPLRQEECMDSFRQAYAFFKNRYPKDFGERPILPFFCSSWLLYKRHVEFLPKHSNILTFMQFFDIFSSREDPNYYDFWRIFYCFHTAKRESFPAETSLQRAYLKWIDGGNLPGHGSGVFFFDGEQIIK